MPQCTPGTGHLQCRAVQVVVEELADLSCVLAAGGCALIDVKLEREWTCRHGPWHWHGMARLLRVSSPSARNAKREK